MNNLKWVVDLQVDFEVYFSAPAPCVAHWKQCDNEFAYWKVKSLHLRRTWHLLTPRQMFCDLSLGWAFGRRMGTSKSAVQGSAAHWNCKSSGHTNRLSRTEIPVSTGRFIWSKRADTSFKPLASTFKLRTYVSWRTVYLNDDSNNSNNFGKRNSMRTLCEQISALAVTQNGIYWHNTSAVIETLRFMASLDSLLLIGRRFGSQEGHETFSASLTAKL